MRIERESRTARELAEARLPGLPASRNRIRKYAEDHSWEQIPPPTGRGGKHFEYLLANLTTEQRAALAEYERSKVDGQICPSTKDQQLRHILSAAVSDAGAEAAAVVDGALVPAGAMPATVAGKIVAATPEDCRAVLARREMASPRAQARGDLYAEVLVALKEELAQPATAAMAAYATAAERAGVSAGRIRAMLREVRGFDQKLWAAVLTPQHAARRCFVELNPAIAAFATGVILERRDQVSDAAVWQVAQAHFGLAAHRERGFVRWVAKFRRDHEPDITIATASDRARSLHQPAHGRVTDRVNDFLEVCELDGSPADIILTVGGRRRQLLALIDVHTRLAAVVVATSESALATGRLVIKFQRKFGMPRCIRTDHGGGFVSVANQALLASVGVETLEIARAHSPEKKPLIEAFMRALSRFCALLPGHAGRNPAQRQALRDAEPMAARRGRSEADLLGAELTDEQLEAALDDWIETVYAHAPHRGLPNRRSPYAQLLEWQKQAKTIRRIDDEAALYGLLGERGVRVIGKRGVQLDGGIYKAPELGRLPGRKVEYRRMPDPTRLAIFTTTAPAELIAIAKLDAAMSREERRDEAIAAGQAFREHRAGVRRAARALKAALPDHPAGIILAAARDNVPIEIAASSFTTSEVKLAREAHDMAAAMRADETAGTGLFATMDAAPAKAAFAYEEEPLTASEQLFESYRALIQRRDRGDVLTEIEMIRIRVYETSPAFKVRQRLGMTGT